MAKEKDSKDSKIVTEEDPEPAHGGDWFWGGEPPETPPVEQPLKRETAKS